MEQHSTWGAPAPSSTSAPKLQATEKHEYIPAMRQVEGMTKGQLETVKRYNSMRDMLLKHGLMDEK